VRLESPTYISMKNSLIIKSGDANFETYYKNMIKRKMAQAMSQSILGAMSTSAANTASQTGRISLTNQTFQQQYDVTSPRSGNVLFVKGKRPPARDGHSSVIVSDQWLVIFGGDRHHMPFNDVFALDLEAEFQNKQTTAFK
jgi:hypothetical protein